MTLHTDRFTGTSTLGRPDAGEEYTIDIGSGDLHELLSDIREELTAIRFQLEQITELSLSPDEIEDT